jgi:hypothetical protein
MVEDFTLTAAVVQHWQAGRAEVCNLWLLWAARAGPPIGRWFGAATLYERPQNSFSRPGLRRLNARSRSGGCSSRPVTTQIVYHQRHYGRASHEKLDNTARPDLLGIAHQRGRQQQQDQRMHHRSPRAGRSDPRTRMMTAFLQSCR